MEGEMEHVVITGKMIMLTILAGIREGRRSIGRLRRTCEDNIKVNQENGV
jgi:hypothetical protein